MTEKIIFSCHISLLWFVSLANNPKGRNTYEKKIDLVTVDRHLPILFCGSALALKEPEVKSAGSVSAGLSKVSGSTYELWGQINGTAGENLTIRVKLYKGNTYITEIFNSGKGPTVYASKNVTLSSGEYRLDITGTTATHTITNTIYKTI